MNYRNRVSSNVVLIYRGKKFVGEEEAMISTITAALLRFAARTERAEGQALAEYGLILALIAVACIVALGFLGLAVSGQLDAITAAMP